MAKTYQEMTVEERRAMVARRDPEKVRAADRARYRRHRQKRLAAQRAYLQTERGRERANAAKAAWRQRNPEKYRAQTAVGNALRDGKLVKRPCEICGDPKVHGHHDDYSKPLEVRWLCWVHHKTIHAA